MRTNSRASQRGFSLVEALVALVVMSIGMLGIAGLYVESLRANRTALLRTQAINLATDMADRIRANRAGRQWYNSAVTADDTNAACEPGGGGCDATAQARHDKAAWIGEVERALPGGTGVVEWRNEPEPLPESYTITVTWAETGVDEENWPSFEMRVLL